MQSNKTQDSNLTSSESLPPKAEEEPLLDESNLFDSKFGREECKDPLARKPRE